MGNLRNLAPTKDNFISLESFINSLQRRWIVIVTVAFQQLNINGWKLRMYNWWNRLFKKKTFDKSVFKIIAISIKKKMVFEFIVLRVINLNTDDIPIYFW